MSWIRIQIDWLKSFLSEETGKASMKRFVMLAVTLTFVKLYSTVAVVDGVVPDIPQTWAMLLAGMIGLGIAAGAVKKNSK